MKKIFLTIIFSLFAGTSHAEEPKYVFVGMDQFTDYFVDVNSVIKINQETISIHKIGQMTSTHETATRIAFIDGIVEIDCVRKINRVVSIVGYDKQGNVVFEASNLKNRIWEDVQPGHGENTLNLACQVK